MARILIADDHAVARRGIREMLADAFPSAEIETVADGESLLKEVIRQTWDLVITDIAMPGRTGLDILQQIRKAFPDLPVLVLSMYSEDEYALRVIKAGAFGFLNKDEAVEEELVKAADTLLRGRKYITPSIAEKLANELSQDQEKQPHELLSDRELHVFMLLAQGRTTGEIADQLSLSTNTIGTFRSRILAKMNMKNNAELVAYAVRNQLI